MERAHEGAGLHGELLPAVLVAKIVLPGHGLDLEGVERIGVGLQGVEARLAVDLDVLVRVEIVREHDDPNGQPLVGEYLQPPDGGILAGGVPVVGDIDRVHISLEEPGLLLREGGAQTRHGVGDPGLVEADHVHVPLHHDEVGKLHALLQIQAVQVVPLVIDGRVAGVDVFGLAVVQHPAAEAQHLAPHPQDGIDKPVPVGVVHPAGVGVLHQQPRVQQLLFGKALGREMLHQIVPALRRVADAEAEDDILDQAPPLGVVSARLAVRPQKLLAVEPGRRLVGRVKPLPIGPEPQELPIILLLGQLHVGPLSEELHRLQEGQMLHVHDELDHGAAGVAAEAIEQLFIRGHGKGRRLLPVERTAGPELAALGLERHIGGDHLRYLVLGQKLVHPFLGKRQSLPPKSMGGP